MLDAEAALARAQAAVGEISTEIAGAIGDLCKAERFDVEAVFVEAALGANPVIPLVLRLREAVGGQSGAAVHRGATSQDIVDTATMLVVSRCSQLIGDRLVQLATSARELAHRHQDTAMIGRTLLQHAVPTTFGSLAASWASGLAEASAELERVTRTLPVQLGGPVGDGSSFGPQGASVVEHTAEILGLAVPTSAWHTRRTPIAAISGALGLVASTVGGVALDIVLLAQSDIGELTELDPGAGGSSSMGHKRNPIAAVSTRAAALQAPGLVATLLHCAGGHELQRAAGAWHAEWPALNGLLRTTGSAVEWLSTSFERLTVEAGRMANNLGQPGVVR